MCTHTKLWHSLVDSVKEICQLLGCIFYFLYLLGALLNNAIAREKLQDFFQQIDFH